MSSGEGLKYAACSREEGFGNYERRDFGLVGKSNQNHPIWAGTVLI